METQIIKLKISNRDFRILSQIANEQYATDRINDLYENETVEDYDFKKRQEAEQ